MCYLIFVHPDHPHAMGVWSNLTPNGRGHDNFQIFVKSSSISVEVAAEYLSDASFIKLVKLCFSQLFFYIKVEFILIRFLDKPGDVLKDDNMVYI